MDEKMIEQIREIVRSEVLKALAEHDQRKLFSRSHGYAAAPSDQATWPLQRAASEALRQARQAALKEG